MIYLFALCFAPLARADLISLRGGGQVQGKVSDDVKDPSRVQLWLLNGKHPLSFEKRQILDIVPKASSLDEYLARKARISAGAGAGEQFELGQWCEQNKLSGLAQAHYEAAVAADKGYELAHQKLGHVLLDGQWLTRDEVRASQGLVKYRGKWITPEEKAQFDRSVKSAAEQSSWVRRIRLLRQALTNGPGDRSREAENQLLMIREPEAVAPLLRVLGDGNVALRGLLIRVLGSIQGPEAASALAARLLTEPDTKIRMAALDQLRDRKERNIEPQLTRALHSSSIPVVNRAAWAIGQLGFVSAVPKLIPALISTEERSVWTRPDGSILGPDAPSVAAGSMNSGPGYYAPGALLADNGSSFAVLTPPAVGPGAVAYGAVAVPYSLYFGGTAALSVANPEAPTENSTGPAASPPALSLNRGPVLRLVVVPVENVEVHNALVSLTNRDFDYNIVSWKNWLRRDFNPHPDPVRRVPQP